MSQGEEPPDRVVLRVETMNGAVVGTMMQGRWRCGQHRTHLMHCVPKKRRAGSTLAANRSLPAPT